MKKDLSQKRFGRLVAIKIVGKEPNGEFLWECDCDCGKKTIVRSSSLISGHTTSCGCYKKDCCVTHRETKTRLYRIGQGMKNRCYNTNIPKYAIYGARGITVCDEWKNDFLAFKDWAYNNGYNGALTIDRIDVNGNYEPANCRWATVKQQGNNTRTNIIIEFNGEKLTAQEWAERLGIQPKTLRKRYYDGMPIEKILYQGDMRCKKNNLTQQKVLK